MNIIIISEHLSNFNSIRSRINTDSSVLFDKFSRLLRTIMPALFLAFLGACTSERTLVDPPNLYVQNGSYPDANLPETIRIPKVKLLYLTDRAIDPQATDKTEYLASRSTSLGFGIVEVSLGETGTWNDLIDIDARTSTPDHIPVKVSNTQELFRFPETPMPFRIRNGRPETLPESIQALRKGETKATEVLLEQMRRNNTRDVLIFVHGVNSSFADASMTLAELWHYSGRSTIPVLYSWPSGNPGMRGYFMDRESGEFTIYHLKTFLRTLAKVPDVENIHILAHSRGTDVVTTSLRELMIESRAAGRNPRSDLKITNLILAAPDLDFGVVRQRLIAEQFGPAIGQVTVYMNTGDSALGLSQWLMDGLRFGRVQADNLSDSDKTIFANVGNVHFVDIEGEGGAFGHSYFIKNPAVLSDIGLIINNNAKPGTAERPLSNLGGNFWKLSENYPQVN